MDFPRLAFEYEFDEQLAYEAEARGHLGGVTVVLADGTRHPVFFYSPTRLLQDLETETDLGRPYIAERGMIVVNTVTYDNMLQAVRDLASEGFFDALPPIVGTSAH